MPILVVEDEPIAMEVLRTMLTKNGYEVEAVCNGVEALDRIRTGAYRMVISDVEMPLMGGLELCEAVRAADLPDYIYMILLTGHDDLDQKVGGLTAGADDYIVKPFDWSELFARIKAGERVLSSALAKHNKELKAQIAQKELFEEELTKSQRRYQLLTEAAPVGIFHADPSGKFEYCNQRWNTITGLPESAAQGGAWAETVHVDDRARVLDEWKTALKQGTPFRSEFRFVKKDGSITWVFGQALAEIDEEGDLVGYVGTVTDITQSRRIQDELLRVAAIVDCSFDAIISETLDGTIMTWNGGAERLYGYTRSEVIGRPIAILLPPDRLNEESVILEAVRRGERVEDFETHRIRKDGTRIEVSLTVSPITNGSNQIVGASKNARDITERRKIETALRLNEQRYRFLADVMPQMVWSTGPLGEMEYCSAGWLEFTQQSLEGAKTRGWNGVLHEEDTALTLTRWNRAIRSGKPFETEHRLLRGSDGAYRWHLSRAHPFKDDTGRIAQWVGTSTDIHDQKLILQELEARGQQLEDANAELSAKNKKLGELYKTAQNFVDDVSHEFRTPLTVIKEYASIIRDGLAGEVSGEQGEYLDIIRNRVDDLATMVDDMLDISKLESGMLGICRRNCTVEQIIDHVRSTLERKAASHKMSLSFDIEDNLPQLYCDLEKIGRVIINLTVNALKFSRENECVKICVRRSDDDPGVVTFSVTDKGPGIAPEAVTVIFNRFKQLGEGLRAGTKGFGLGLNIAKELVLLNLGEIGLRSELSAGSTFFFSVPVADPHVVLSRWLRLTLRIANSATSASILSITCDSCGSPDLVDELDEFLQRNLRYSDLLLPIEPEKWVMIAKAGETEVNQMFDRIQQSWSDENRNRPGNALPELILRRRGTFELPQQHREFMDDVESQLAKEASLVPQLAAIATGSARP